MCKIYRGFFGGSDSKEYACREEGSKWWDSRHGRGDMKASSPSPPTHRQPPGSRLDLAVHSPVPHGEDGADPEGQAGRAGQALRRHGHLHESHDGAGRRAVQRGVQPAVSGLQGGWGPPVHLEGHLQHRAEDRHLGQEVAADQGLPGESGVRAEVHLHHGPGESRGPSPGAGRSWGHGGRRPPLLPSSFVWGPPWDFHGNGMGAGACLMVCRCVWGG